MLRPRSISERKDANNAHGTADSAKSSNLRRGLETLTLKAGDSTESAVPRASFALILHSMLLVVLSGAQVEPGGGPALIFSLGVFSLCSTYSLRLSLITLRRWWTSIGSHCRTYRRLMTYRSSLSVGATYGVRPARLPSRNRPREEERSNSCTVTCNGKLRST